MLEQYRGIASDAALEEIETLAGVLQGRRLQHVNSTRFGGGVAEILQRLVPLLDSLGLRTRWDVITGPPEFFEVTKAMHNALQGADLEIPHVDLELYQQVVRENAARLRLEGDVVVVHDPQPAYLVRFTRLEPHQRAVWRCHIDLSHPNERVWRFLREATDEYDMMVFHTPHFAHNTPVPQVLIAPSIDPLSEKNRPLSEAEITAVTERFGIDRRRPLLVQVSRFDRFKDPLGVVEAYRQVQQSFDCQLVLAGGGATDDPEGPLVRALVEEAAGTDPDVFVLSNPTDLEVNALQRAATVILQKSTREGFGLTVTEAMWKGKPVVGGAAGGIPAQIIDGINGFLVHSPEGAAFRLRYLLSHPHAIQRMGALGREHVRRNFLITRHVKDYLLLMLLVERRQADQPLFLSRSRPGRAPTAA